jgi:hypothetical protein
MAGALRQAGALDAFLSGEQKGTRLSPGKHANLPNPAENLRIDTIRQ